jgi:polar amino acid transport system substrate-binding protein
MPRSHQRRLYSACRIAHGIIVILAAAALTACGGMAVRIPPLPPVPHPALSGPAIAQIQRAGVLRVASDLSYPPMEFRENGAPRGFEIDLAALLAEGLGVRLEVVDTPLALMRTEFPVGVDMLLSAIPTEGAAAVGWPSEPYYVSSQAILWRDGSPVRTPQDLHGLRVAVAANSPGEAVAAGAGILSVTYLPEQAMEEVATGRVQVAVGDRPALVWYAQTHPHLHVSAGAWREAPLVVMTRWEASDLAGFVTVALHELKANGGLDQLRRRWHL